MTAKSPAALWATAPRWLYYLLPLVALVPTLQIWNPGAASVYYDATWPPDYSVSDIRTWTFQYSPAFALAVQPFRLLPWPVFAYFVVVAATFSLAYLVGPVLAIVLILADAPLIGLEMRVGQLNIIFAALLVLAMSRPALWAPMLLAKATPGIGLLWFAVRREWRYFATALGATAAIGLAVFVLSPGSWFEWIATLLANVPLADGEAYLGAASVPFGARILLALPVIVWGALTNRPWTIALAIAMTQPRNGHLWLMLLAVPRLLVNRDGLVVGLEPVDVEVVELDGAIAAEPKGAVGPGRVRRVDLPASGL